RPYRLRYTIYRYILRTIRTKDKLYAKAVLKFAKLNTAAQQREAVVQGRSLLPYRLRYKIIQK
ncbi:MAG: hypothetical protein LBH59_07730, partial [Planctomycetaceae bacterium]|nr:hypothetical protein [Planctomycetaceae bacterium]